MRAVVVLSGGQDSATVFALAASMGGVMGAIHFEYGQRHAVERECAQWWADRYRTPLTVIPVSSLKALGNTALIGGGAVNAVHPTLRHLPASFVPGRNIVFLTLAAAYAMRIGANEVWAGMCQNDAAGYPDCRQSAVDAIEAAIILGMDFKGLQIMTPLMLEDKADTFRLAAELQVLDDVIEHTHTCYLGDRGERHEWGYGCGTCTACMARKAGWQEYKAA